MASIIRVKRSTGTIAPPSLNFGELGLTVGVGTHGNGGGRLFAGDPSNNLLTIGGRYYTDLLSIAPGLVSGQTNPTTAANGFVAVLDQNRKVDQWNVDNIRIDGNIISSTDTDGHINLDPDGTGEIIIPDDTFLTFGTSRDSKIEYDENGTDKLTFTGADIRINITTESTTKDTGALIVEGGVGIEKNLNVGGNVDIDLDLNVDGGDITTNQTLFNLLNATATTVNAFGAATAVNLGANGGTLTVGNPTVVGTQATQNLYNTTATTVNFAGDGTAVTIGATTGTATIRNGSLNVPNATTLNLGSTSSVTSVTFPSTPNTSFVSIAATTNATSTTTGALRVSGGVGIAKDLYVGGTLTITGSQTTLTGNLEVQGNTTLGNASTDIVTITGVVNHTGPLINVGGVTIDNVGISSNVISTKSGGGNVLYIDPYPDGLSNEGMVVIKGNLQVDGTTTTVDSSSVTVNGAIISLGDVTSNRTVVLAVLSGVSTISLDSVVGINTGDIISGSASLPNSGLTTITAYNTSTKIVTITGTTTSGIASASQLIITHAFDTNTDRGISFDYNTSVGTANHKSGFFGFDDSSIASSNSTVDNHGTHANDSRKWTYVPDATITNSTVAGTKGFLDVKGIYYQSGDFSLGGAVYFDSQGLQRSTNAVASPTITSKQILTAVTEINLTVTAVSVTEGDLISQVTSGAYGVVKTTSAGTTITVIGVEGTFNTVNDLLINGTSISRIPSAATTIYTNKPTWTSTLDGGTF